ncbi:hypothetical protein OG896_39735 [Streptomyces sp. NBC_00669]|uniref:hypothetical protein n=1 Tax=Streptomyces sp. NBC_00669 TaxID=2976011 RepID=UPI002E3824E2|nr:hypothetical protein [Streptomyces sp. NBC_00669]
MAGCREAAATPHVRIVFGIPQVRLVVGQEIAGRTVSHHPRRECEREVLAWTGHDAEDGVDYGHVPYARRPNGEPVFDDPEIFDAPVHPYDEYPGRVLLKALLGYESETKDL